jgi:thiol:disulfide interchange protein DsbD
MSMGSDRRRSAFVWTVVAAVVLGLAWPPIADAQLRRPRATLTPIVEASGAHPGSTIRVAVKAQLPDKSLHVQSDKPRDPTFIPTVFTIEPPAGVTVQGIAYPPATELKQEGLTEPLDVFESEFAIGAELTIASSVAPGPIVIPARLRYQACDDKVCYAPTTGTLEFTVQVVPASTAITRAHADVFKPMTFSRVESAAPLPIPRATTPTPAAGSIARLDDFKVVATTGGYLPSGDFLQFVSDAETGVVSRGLFDGRGPIAILLIVLLGGLALNLTPCVLPMIPINLAIIGAGANAGSRRRGFLLGSTYGAAMALVYGVLGLVVVLTAGTFGSLNASPWFNVAIAIVFVLLALAMFDIFEIDLSRFSSGFQGGGASRGSFALAFMMGGIAALLAGACVAPVVIQVVLFASSMYSSGTVLALALPFCLGLGMALPWPLAGAGLAALPKPGAWMVRVKQAFGVVILGVAVYYGYLGYTLFADRWVDPAAVQASVQEKLKDGWYASLDEGLAVAARDQKPVLVDMWATWCKNCLTMDATTFADPAVVKALDGYVKIKYQAEDPDAPEARALMTRFSAVGLPAYAILQSGSTPTEGAAAPPTGGAQ